MQRSSSVPSFTLDQIGAAIDRRAVLDAVRAALVDHAHGRSELPPPTYIQFRDTHGDCHVKTGYLHGGDIFVVKVASGFQDNPKIGLPVNSGMVLAFDARTGQPRAVLQDEGWLTSWRTAAAGAIAAEALAPASVEVIGVIGTGHQARMQLDWLREVVGCRRVLIWGRRADAARELAAELEAMGYASDVAGSARQLLERSRLVVTTTASSAPLFDAGDVHPGTHITALGADAPGKQELDPRLLARARVVAADDLEQCLDHGELGHARRAGMLGEVRAVALGALLAGEATGREQPSDITVADLTGLAIEDVAIASVVLARMASRVAG